MENQLKALALAKKLVCFSINILNTYTCTCTSNSMQQNNRGLHLQRMLSIRIGQEFVLTEFNIYTVNIFF